MSYTIKTELGEFTADDEKGAKKLLRAAQKEDVKQTAIRDANHVVAMGEAYKQAYAIFDRKMRGEDMPCGWRILPVSETSYACRKLPDCDYLYSIETGHGGRATIDVYDGITHYLENGAGFAMAVVIQRQDCELFAVGCHAGVGCTLALFGVKVAEFSQPENASAESAA